MKRFMEDNKESIVDLYLSNDNFEKKELFDICSIKNNKNDNIIDSNINQKYLYCKKKRVPFQQKIKEPEVPSKREDFQEILFEKEIEFNTEYLLETNNEKSNGLISHQNMSDDIMNSFFIFRGHLLRDLRHIKLYNKTAINEKGLNKLKKFVIDFFKYYRDFDEDLNNVIIHK